MNDLKILRKLNVGLLSPEFVAHLNQFENGPELVEADRPRDYWMTDEVVASTESFALAGPDGEVLDASFGTLAEAEKARDGAKLSIKFELADGTPLALGDESEDVRLRLGYSEPSYPAKAKAATA